MRGKCPVQLGIFALLLGTVCAGWAAGFESLAVFSEQYPKSFFFRRPEGLAASNPYAAWRTNLNRLDGVMMKVFHEELTTLSTNALPYLQQFAADESSQIALVHFNGQSRDPKFFGTNFSAGHWLYFPGCGITQGISLADTVICATNTSLFRTNYGNDGAHKNDDIVLVPLDDAGKRLWDQAEQVRLVSINSGSLTVDRGQYGTAPRAFTAGRTYVAPHVNEGPWGDIDNNNLMWFYNYATTCPRDGNGHTAGDVLAAQIAGWFAPGGPLEQIHGIQFDVSPWTKKAVSGRKVDADADGVGDQGLLGGTNVYGLGVYQFYRTLRYALGEGKLMLADGETDNSQRAVGILNGIEAESFSGLNDPYLGEWSTAINRLLYWEANVQRSNRLNYVNHKITALTNDVPANLTRIVLAAAANLGIASPYSFRPANEPGELTGIWDELRGGTNRTARWLGRPIGPMRRLALDAPDLLAGEGVAMSPAFVGRWTSTNATFTKNGDTLTIAASAGATNSLVLNCTNLSIPPGDLFIACKIRAEPLSEFPADVPRQVFVRALGRQPFAGTADEVAAYAGTNEFPVSFYFREAGPAAVTLQITVEGTNRFFIREFTVRSAADALAREFEHGIVLCNPASNNCVFTPRDLFPGNVFQRLTATSRQDTNVNNGAAVGSAVTVGPLDGLFLIKTPVPRVAPELHLACAGADTFELRWPAISNGLYTLQQAADLPGPWSNREVHLPGNPPVNSHILVESNGQAFFRLLVE